MLKEWANFFNNDIVFESINNQIINKKSNIKFNNNINNNDNKINKNRNNNYNIDFKNNTFNNSNFNNNNNNMFNFNFSHKKITDKYNYANKVLKEVINKHPNIKNYMKKNFSDNNKYNNSIYINNKINNNNIKDNNSKNNNKNIFIDMNLFKDQKYVSLYKIKELYKNKNPKKYVYLGNEANYKSYLCENGKFPDESDYNIETYSTLTKIPSIKYINKYNLLISNNLKNNNNFNKEYNKKNIENILCMKSTKHYDYNNI